MRLWSGLKGSIAKCLARLMARANPRWCFEQTPVFRLASTMNRSERNRLIRSTFL